MASAIGGVFDFVAAMFDKIPVLNKFKGYRSVVGFVGLAVIAVLRSQGIGSAELLSYLDLGFLTFTGLALNAKGRE